MRKINLIALTFFIFGLIFTDIISAYSSSDEVLWVSLIIVAIYGGIFIFYFLVAYWVYKDAKKRKAENPMLWGVLAFFAGPILGLILWDSMKNL